MPPSQKKIPSHLRVCTWVKVSPSTFFFELQLFLQFLTDSKHSNFDIFQKLTPCGLLLSHFKPLQCSYDSTFSVYPTMNTNSLHILWRLCHRYRMRCILAATHITFLISENKNKKVLHYTEKVKRLKRSVCWWIHHHVTTFAPVFFGAWELTFCLCFFVCFFFI